MSPADKAELLTPLMRLQRRRRAARAFVALLVAGVVLLAGTVLAVNDARNYKRLANWLGVEDYLLPASPPPLQPPARYRRATQLAAAPSQLVDPRTDSKDIFRRFPSLAARDRCGKLAIDGSEPPTFQGSDTEWECLFTLEIGGAPEPSMLFIQVRGSGSDTIRTFRAKLNLLDPCREADLIGATLGAIDRFGLDLSPESRAYLEDRIEAGAEFSSSLENYRISLDRERSDDRRLNLLIAPRPPTQACRRPGIRSNGAPMHSTTVPGPLACLTLTDVPLRLFSGAIEPH
jgi:hypothetical protein